MKQIQYGGGAVSPKVAAHVQQAAKPKVQTGGGAIAPKVAVHAKQAGKQK